MSVYPTGLDSDTDINRVDEGVTENLGTVTNQLRDAVFNMQGEMGLGLSGSVGSLADRISVSLNANGTIKQSALTAVGLVTLPIADTHVGSNAGIKETKLALDHSTSDLYTLIISNKSLLDSVNSFLAETSTNFLNHLAGALFLSDGSTSARHVASHIDLNSVPTDSRDTNYTWTGLLNKLGVARTATTVAQALLQINNSLVDHENSESEAHVALAVSVDPSEFQEIPQTVTDVQKLADYLDDSEVLNIGQHRAVQHAAGIPTIARSSSLINGDGYGDTIVPSTLVNTYRQHPPSNSPVDSNVYGDDIIQFTPVNTGFVFDSQFKLVKPGDIVKVNYGNGIATKFLIESKRHIVDSEWFVRINGINLAESVDGTIDGYGDGYAYATIERPLYDSNTCGVLAVAAANSIPSNLYPEIIGSVIVGDPKAAVVLGLGFDPNQINSTHYNLYLQLYPTGNPSDLVINLPAIDVTGNAGITPGAYTIESIVQQTNNSFRKVGYNYRFIAFEHNGDFAIMLADSINNAGFSIINSTGTANIVADDVDGFDALGFGNSHAGAASPSYQSTFADTTAAMTPTLVHLPARYRNYIVNGQRLNDFAPTFLANDDGYWPATINAKVSTGSSVEVTFKVELDLCSAGLAPGKTLVIQPNIDLDDANYVTNDYGRFIIKDVTFSGECGDVAAFTTITVINGVHATGAAISFTSGVGLAVRMYFSGDSVGFNDTNVITAAFAGVNYHRFHEIYVDDTGKTFSHERARLVAQNESATLLSTNNWHVKGVSSKIKGYVDDAVTQNRYIRFYINSFDSASGEYTGYIGQRDPASATILKTGPLTTGRKNVTTRFYDESYIDYIDLSYEELSVGPGSSILSTSAARYVDIEIFPSLRLQDELLLLASCEVNWEPATGQNIIQSVKSMRQFGSIAEDDFTESALNFISAADQALHENGVIRGFEFDSSGVTTGELFYKGGAALVDGRLVVTNASSVTIPQISEGGATPATVTWAVCVNKSGYLEPILITATKDQFFAGTSDYYVPSVTFAELITSRRDLTPISLVSAAIASITINNSDVTDIRRFIGQSGLSQPIVLSSDSLTGNFNSLESVAAWVKNYGVTGSKLKVRVIGNLNVSSVVDLSELSAPIEFEGDNAQINVTSGQGLLISGDVSFKNINFTYNPSGLVYTANDYINRTNGCIFKDDTDTLCSNITIQDCKFSCTMAGTQRPPFIMFELAAADLLNNLKIVGNRFEDSTTIDQAAIAIIAIGSGTVPVISNSLIEKNHVNENQGCYLTSLASTSGTGASSIKTFAAPGLRIAGVTVRDNTFGTIGYVSSGRANNAVDGYHLESMLSIDSNRAMFIGTTDQTGKSWVSYLIPTYLVVNFGTGHVKITNNHAAWINAVVRDESASNISSSILISGNTLSAFSDEYYESRYGVYFNTAIYVTGLSTDKGSVQIIGNTINKRLIGSDVHQYEWGMFAGRSATITNNVIRGFAGHGGFSAGIVLQPVLNTVANFIIQGNSLYRNGDNLGTSGAYILNCGAGSTDSFALICDNFFDSSYIDADNTINYTIRNFSLTVYPTYWRIERNKNHIKTAYVTGYTGKVSIHTGTQAGNMVTDPTSSSVLKSYSTFNNQSLPAVTLNYRDTVGPLNIYCDWIVPLAGVLPIGSVIVSVSATFLGETDATTSTATLNLGQLGTSTKIKGPTVMNDAGSTLTITSAAALDFTEGTFIVNEALNNYVSIQLNAAYTSNFTMSAGYFVIQYKE